jgi:hypothetical protein
MGTERTPGARFPRCEGGPVKPRVTWRHAARWSAIRPPIPSGALGEGPLWPPTTCTFARTPERSRLRRWARIRPKQLLSRRPCSPSSATGRSRSDTTTTGQQRGRPRTGSGQPTLGFRGLEQQPKLVRRLPGLGQIQLLWLHRVRCASSPKPCRKAHDPMGIVDFSKEVDMARRRSCDWPLESGQKTSIAVARSSRDPRTAALRELALVFKRLRERRIP